jgi:hypothetical protein
MSTPGRRAFSAVLIHRRLLFAGYGRQVFVDPKETIDDIREMRLRPRDNDGT